MSTSLVVLITGGSAGIGAVTAEYFAEKGHIVYEISRSGKDRPNIRHLTGDVTKPEELKAAVDLVLKENGRLDVAISNAGFGIGGSVENTETEAAERQFAVNFQGCVNFVQAVIPALRQSGGGRLLATSSVAAVVPIPFQAFYSASKAAVNQLFLALDNELRPFKIQCAVLMPGDTKTDFTAKREKNPAEAKVYGDRVARSLAKMEKDEMAGGSPEPLARALYRLATKRTKPKVLNGCGAFYRLALGLMKFLPIRLANRVVGKLYADG